MEKEKADYVAILKEIPGFDTLKPELLKMIDFCRKNKKYDR